jgi:sister chromatid cohesion protein DCC1
VETSNTLLLMQPPRGLDDRVAGGGGDVADADADGTTDGNTAAAKRQKHHGGDAGLPDVGAPGSAPGGAPDGGAGLPEPARAEAGAHLDAGATSADSVCPVGQGGLKDLTAFAQADSHLELELTAPRVDPMW